MITQSMMTRLIKQNKDKLQQLYNNLQVDLASHATITILFVDKWNDNNQWKTQTNEGWVTVSSLTISTFAS